MRYCAFLSYSHTDEKHADWLHRCLEQFRVPPALIGRVTPRGVVPRKLGVVFRDRQELAASSDLGGAIREAIAQSRALIVLCSPAAARSHWTNEEILAFRRQHPGGLLLAAIVGGEPYASEIPGREAEECFPPALRERFDARGEPTGERGEPIAADLRAGRDGRRMGLLKIVAGLLGVGLDDLVQRETQRRQKRLAILAAGSLAGMAVTSSLAVAAFVARDEARDQRREAEGLVGFMLGDLRNKLEPIGRLDALDAVGARALSYYSGQDKSSLSDGSLAQRAKALALMGQIATARGDLDGALKRYGEAFASTGELLDRHPDDGQRVFDHAQNVFWVGQIAFLQGKSADAERSWREYKRLAERMIALEPANPKWRMEIQYADANLGIVLFKQRRFQEASKLFERAVATIEALAAAQPGNRDHQLSMATSLAWLADAQRAVGSLGEAIAQRERQIAVLERGMAAGKEDVGFREALIPAREALGRLLASHGEVEAAVQSLGEAVAEAKRLVATEPENMQWRGMAASAHIALAEVLAASKRYPAAAAQARAGCEISGRLSRRADSTQKWRAVAVRCMLVRAQLALAGGSKAEALALGTNALQAIPRAWSSDPVEQAYMAAGARRVVGDVHLAMGDREAAAAQWGKALASLPRGVTERPWELSERAELLRRLGRNDEAARAQAVLASIGFHRFF